MPSSYTLGGRFEALVKELVQSRYKNASEVVRDGLRLLEESASDCARSSSQSCAASLKRGA